MRVAHRPAPKDIEPKRPARIFDAKELAVKRSEDVVKQGILQFLLKHKEFYSNELWNDPIQGADGIAAMLLMQEQQLIICATGKSQKFQRMYRRYLLLHAVAKRPLPFPKEAVKKHSLPLNINYAQWYNWWGTTNAVFH